MRIVWRHQSPTFGFQLFPGAPLEHRPAVPAELFSFPLGRTNACKNRFLSRPFIALAQAKADPIQSYFMDHHPSTKSCEVILYECSGRYLLPLGIRLNFYSTSVTMTRRGRRGRLDQHSVEIFRGLSLGDQLETSKNLALLVGS
jgi:hypothetical protein